MGRAGILTLNDSGWKTTKSKQIWRVEEAGFKPSLAYPVQYVLSWQMVGIISLSSLSRSETGFYKPHVDHFLDGFKHGPHFDDDSWYYNYVAHPLWGSETYLRARSQGFKPFESFLFSTGASLVWEFGFESWVARPSYQDLFVTSTSGWLLGELRYHLKQSLLDSDDPNYFLVTVVDPLQTLTEYIGRVFGQDWREPAYQKVPSGENIPFCHLDIGIVEEEIGLIVQFQGRF